MIPSSSAAPGAKFTFSKVLSLPLRVLWVLAIDFIKLLKFVIWDIGIGLFLCLGMIVPGIIWWFGWYDPDLDPMRRVAEQALRRWWRSVLERAEKYGQ